MNQGNNLFKDDSTYQLPATVTTEGDSTYINVTKEDIKAIHDRIFTEQVSDDQFMRVIVKVELFYVPVLFFILILATIVNMRWNRAFERIKRLSKEVDMTEGAIEKIGILKAQRVNLWDRIFVYIVIWMSSMVIDLFLMLSEITSFPFALMMITAFVISKVLKRLVEASALKGVDDKDIIKRFEEMLDVMIVKPIVNLMASKVAKTINRTNKDKQHEE